MIDSLLVSFIYIHKIIFCLQLFKFELLEGDYDLWNCVCLSAGKYIERVSFFNCFGEVVQNAITKFLQDFTFKMLEVVNEVLTDEIA